MNRPSKLANVGLVAGAWLALAVAPVEAQIYTRPIAPNPSPAGPSILQPVPVQGGYALAPVYPPPISSYYLYGPSTGTVGFAASTSYYPQSGPCGDRVVRSTVLVPVWGYTPGYYSGYDTVRYFRP
jgi:hypothetical protein